MALPGHDRTKQAWAAVAFETVARAYPAMFSISTTNLTEKEHNTDDFKVYNHPSQPELHPQLCQSCFLTLFTRVYILAT